MVEEKLSMEDVVRHVENIHQKESRVVKGYVIDVNRDNNTVLVDIGYKSEGIISLDEFEEQGKEINKGDEVEVYVVHRSPGYEQPPILSYKKAQQEHQIEKLEKAFEDELVIDAKLEHKVKGGLIADIGGGVKAFMPASLVGYPMVKNLDSVLGNTVPCKIIDFDKSKKNFVVSWRKAIEDDVRRKREELFDQLYPGKVISGKVTGIKSFGAFIDLGGIDGLLHISEISWGHVDKVEDVLKIGDEIEVKVKSFNPNSNKIALSLKDTKPHPWEGIEEKFHVGDEAEGKVTGVTSYGAFVELEPGVEGLVRTEELSWVKDVRHAGDELAVGDDIKVKVLDIDSEDKKISLSYRQTMVNPWEEVAQKYQVSNVIKGKVTHLTDFGAFVLLAEGVEGLIHISDMSWDRNVGHPSEVVKVDDEVEVKILSIDPDKQKISLGIKQMASNPFEDFPVGKPVKGTVKSVNKTGAVIQLNDELDAYLHVSNFSSERTEDLQDHMSEGDEVDCLVIKNNPARNSIEVSIKDYAEDQDRKEIRKYTEPKEGSGTTLKDLVGDKFDSLSESSREDEPEVAEAGQEEEEIAETEEEPEETETEEPDTEAEEEEEDVAEAEEAREEDKGPEPEEEETDSDKK